MTACMRVLTCGEGPKTNLAQFCDLLLEYQELGYPAKILYHLDDSCGQISHMLVELVKLAQGCDSGNPIINKYPYVLLAAIAADLSVDAFHAWKGHVGEFCVRFLDSRTRKLPKGSNSSAGEQQWQHIPRLTRSLNYMNAGMHEFWKLTHFALQNTWRLQMTESQLKQLPVVKSKSVYWFDGKPMGKHAYRAKVVQASKRQKVTKKRTKTPPKKLNHRTNSRRLPMTGALKRELPLGFDERLLKLDESGERRAYTDFQVEWFKDNYDELIERVKQLLDTPMAPTLEAKFAAKAYLHKWLVDRVVAAKNGGE